MCYLFGSIGINRVHFGNKPDHVEIMLVEGRTPSCRWYTLFGGGNTTLRTLYLRITILFKQIYTIKKHCVPDIMFTF